jgi:hypothetical protein
MAGIGHKPVYSIASYLGPNDRHDPGFDAGSWTYRGLRCAGYLGDSVAAHSADVIYARFASDPQQWEWLVDENWHYAVPDAKRKAGE